MATYRPAAFPLRPKHSNLFTETRYQIQLAYYRFELTTGQYVMTPGEKSSYNTVILSILALLFVAVYYYLPSTVHVSLQRLAYYFTGSHRINVDSVGLARNVLQNAGIAGVVDAANASMELVP